MKKVPIILTLLLSIITVLSSNSQESKKVNVEHIIQDLKAKNILYSLDQAGIPFKKGEYIIKLRGAKYDKSKEQTIVEEFYKAMETVNVPKPDCRTVTTTIVPCDCSDFTYILIKVICPPNGPSQDDVVVNQPAVVKPGGGGLIEEINPNYFIYDSRLGASRLDRNLNYSRSNPYQGYIRSRMKIIPQNPIGKALNSKTVLIGLVDSGVDITNPDIVPYIANTAPLTPFYNNDRNGYDFVEHLSNLGYNRSNIFDYYGHGTHIAQNMIELLNRDFKKNDIRILPVKVIDGKGYSTVFSASCGLIYAMKKGAKIINASWYTIYSNRQSEGMPFLETAIQKSNNEGVMIVTCSGNEGQEIGTNDFLVYPAVYNQTYDNVFTVNADLDNTGGVHLLSNRGLDYIDLTADGTTPVKIGTATYSGWGTSYATGLVSLGAAVIKFQNPSYNYLQIRDKLLTIPYSDHATLPVQNRNNKHYMHSLN